MIGNINANTKNIYYLNQHNKSDTCSEEGNDIKMSKSAIKTEKEAKDADLSDSQIRGLKRSGQIECETCKNRKYQDGSDENVSFKAAAHISPNASASAVRAHEQEHVANAYEKAKQHENAKVISANVKIITSVCPECGRTYVSGGETTTQIKYNEDNPYSKAAKTQDYINYGGSVVDMAV
ncbi:hypothetical protein SAMN05216249_10817 [Acetitomaculum ruminis DSM 5522]|uniref:Uncharacterized protein n=1 Tax=Acetitomaculum ruminis DSM 5522 TaxID=1120918 RepID=A0A1I0XZM1_9FIRM|nr:hypothetical protein [Acetitomaculum ruminis]SFB05820.1 hypothetical protein SAMN05216249_10817 [Acetitomaculum ruminis DSM 5522]